MKKQLIRFGRFMNHQCKYCGGELVHRWHTSSKEIDICSDCGKQD